MIAWHFDQPGEPGVPKVAFAAGPRPPIYPSFDAKNQALDLGDAKAAFAVRESDVPNVNLRFAQGETITLEAWVRAADIRDGGYSYILGKGRNGNKKYPEKNQNYSLRLSGQRGEACISFLFGSAAEPGKPADWHRWTSTKGFTGAGWHHIAITYTFGNPKSIRGIIDGEVVAGTWDMGGATTRAPANDDDHLMIGTGNGGGAGNSFRGWVDGIAIWRGPVPQETLKSRYEFVPPPPAIARKDVPAGEVLVQICEEGMPSRNAWPDFPLQATESYREQAFGFFAVPHKYVETGVRGDRPNPFLVRAAARIDLPAGKHRLLLRGRGASRVYINDQLVLSTPFNTRDSSGHGTIPGPETYLNLGPDFRFAPPGNRENWITYESTGGEHFVILETIVGSYLNARTMRRPELGETVVAISPQGSESWQLLSPATRVIPYTDAGWAAYEAERTTFLEGLNDQARAVQRAKHATYWNQRRDAAQKWLNASDAVPVPALPAGFPANNPIDHFLAEAIARARAQEQAAKRGTVDFFADVQPLLEAKCYGCHAGSKVKGDLRLDDRAAALTGGSSDGPAVSPGKPATSALLTRLKAGEDDGVMPPKGERLTEAQIRLIETWIAEGAHWPDLKATSTKLTPLTEDLAFLRRIALDTVGVVPTPNEIAEFLADPPATRRNRAIDRYLADHRWADNWVGYWQDVLAENPNILNPTLNNTGPFRWWLYESFRDNKPMDLFVTELLRLGGSTRFGGPAGFGVASQNDSPFAAKASIAASAFLGVEMKCARCHDAPAHRSTQEDLFALGAMLGTKSLTVPVTSSVPLDKIHQGGRKPLITVTLKPGTAVAPAWPFEDFVSAKVAEPLAEKPDSARDRLAALITAPQNERFAQVIANRVWARLMGRGIVEPVDDWERAKPSHPELLRWLGREFVREGYDLKKLTRLILQSHAYQRATDPELAEPSVLFASPAPRRLTAEQIVDSLFHATGKPFALEEVSLDIDGARDLGNSITMGMPRRAWMLTSTSNERDRPSLALPRIQAVIDVLEAFGWRAARQDPVSTRDHDPNVLQPAILSNGTVATWLTRLSDDHGVTRLALKDQPLDRLLDDLFLQLLTRLPTDEERTMYRAHLEQGYANRLREPTPPPAVKRMPQPYVSWSNHLHPEATIVRQKQEAAARAGDPPTTRLDPNWRNRLEDVLWAILNAPEFVYAP